MPFGLTVSILLHLSVLAWALINLHSTPPFNPPELQPVEVALISPDDLVRLRQGSRDAKQLDAQPNANNAKQPVKEQPKPKLQAAAPPPPPPPAAEPPPPEPAKSEPKPPEPVKSAEPVKDPIAEKLASLPPEPEGPSPEELKQREEQEKAEQEKKRQEEIRKAEEERKHQEEKAAEDKRKADEKRKAEEAKKRLEQQKKLAEEKRRAEEAKKKQFDADKIAALLNKVPDKSAPPAGAPSETPTKTKGPVAGAPEGRDSQLTASQRALLGVMMKRAVSRCWNINSGLEGIDRVVVDVEVKLTPDGRLQQPPRVTNSGPGALFNDAANSAIRALVQCEPYDLPTDLYRGGWDHMVVTFDPQRMF